MTASLDTAGHVLEICAEAKALEASGDFTAAQEILADRWPRFDERPILDGLDTYTAAHLLLRVSSLTGWIGETQRIEGAQQRARKLLGDSYNKFDSIGVSAGAAEALAEIAWCYWREGAYEDARTLLRRALARCGAADVALKASTLVRAAVVERMSGRLYDALHQLDEASPLVGTLHDHQLQGRFHGERAVLLRNLGAVEDRRDYIDRALIEYAAASYHLERAGNLRFCGYVENNLGHLYATLGRFGEAYEHLDKARSIFDARRERGNVAQVDETRARALLSEGKPANAELVIRDAWRVHEEAAEWAFMTQALTTHAVALARMGCYPFAREEILRAIVVAKGIGDLEGAGKACLTLIEEMGELLPPAELRSVVADADNLLSHSQHEETRLRLQNCVERVRNISGHQNVVPLKRTRTHALQTFTVRISDDSLIGVGIKRGDLVRMRKAEEYKDGDLVTAETSDGIFVVFIYTELNGKLRLVGAHPDCPVRHFAPDDIYILGIAHTD